jgi:hypothetical protein
VPDLAVTVAEGSVREFERDVCLPGAGANHRPCSARTWSTRSDPASRGRKSWVTIHW